jgi:spore germination cell wall hydrolase CwlJ-like protein
LRQRAGGVGVFVASRVRVLRASYSARFWLSACCAALMPTSVGYQDLAALISHRPSVSASYHEHLIFSPFGSIERATFSFTRPIGTVIPEPVFQNVNFDPRSLDAYAWKIDEALTTRTSRRVEYPTINRTHKTDRLPAADVAPAATGAPTDPAPPQPRIAPGAPVAAPPIVPAMPVAPVALPQPVPTERRVDAKNTAPPAVQMDAAAAAPAIDTNAPAAADSTSAAVPHASNVATIVSRGTAKPAAENINPASAVLTPAAQHRNQAANVVTEHAFSPPERGNARGGGDGTETVMADKPPELPAPGEMTVAQSTYEASFIDGGVDRSAQIYFGSSVLGAPSGLQSWAPGTEPILVSPPDTNIRLSSLESTDSDNDEYGGDETFTGKDQSRALTPAQRLGLAGKPRADAEKCLADAVYFEARGEVMKGQEAVAQVVMNRVFSGYYPHDVCGVVYQNAHRHLACQFTFACEGKDLNKIDEPDMWEQAKRIARDMLDGKIWLAEVGHATHYHAYWVHPTWVHEMTRLYHLGVHTFYRPRNWNEEPDWGPNAPATTASIALPRADFLRPDPEVLRANPEPNPAAAEASIKAPQASAAPTPAADSSAPIAKL